MNTDGDCFEVLRPLKNTVIPPHSILVHNFYAERKRACPYCLKGSEPVPMDVIRHG